MDVRIGELEDLFERYRSGQDLRALSKLFDLAAPELLRLAVHMAPDVASAEDLVQQTFLAAIEKPRRWRSGEPLLPWLFGILSNLAKKQRRGLRRTPEPDRLARREPEDPAQQTLSEETRSAIRSALEHVPELYREVVRASLFDEKPPHEIARELDRAPGTVRMQLLRGLELLRRALPAGLAGGALVLCGTRGEAGLKAAVLEKAAGATSVVLATSTLTLGGLLVSTKAVLAVVVAVAGLCAWVLWPRVEPVAIASIAQGESRAPVAVQSGSSELAPVETVAAQERAEVGAVAAGAIQAARSAGGIFLVGQLSGVAPEHAAQLELQVQIGGHGEVKGTARADGSFELELTSVLEKHVSAPDMFGIPQLTNRQLPYVPGESSELEIWVRHPLYISEHESIAVTDLFAPLAPGERRETRCDLRLRAAAVVSGRVRVPAGWNVEEADVRIDTRAHDMADVLGLAVEHSNCDLAGSYTIKSMRHGELLVRAELPGLLPTAVYVRVEQGQRLELPDLVLEEGLSTIRGRLDLPAKLLDTGDGFPRGLRIRGMRSGVEVVARRIDPAGTGSVPGALGGQVLDERGARQVPELRGGCAVLEQSSPIGAGGSFVLRALEPGKWELTIEGIRDNGTLPLLEKMIVDAPADGIVIGESLGSISLSVLDSAGPVRGASVTVGDESTFMTFQTGDDGRILLLGDLRKDYTANASGPGRDKAFLALPAVGRLREASFELRLCDAPQPATLVFLPVEGASPPKSVQLRLDPGEGESTLQARNEKLELANGRYELGGILPGRWNITVSPGEEKMPVAFFGGYMLSERFEATLAPGAKVDHRLRCENGGRLRLTIEADASLKSNGFGCKLVSLEGKPVEARIFVSSVSGEGFGVFGAGESLRIMGERTQAALQDCLPPGRYELRLTSDKVHAKPLVFEIRLGETTHAAWKIEK